MRKSGFTLMFCGLLFIATASATIIGDLKTGSGGTLTISLTSFTFNNDPSANPPGPPWNGEVALGTSLRFAGCPSGVLGTPGCLDSGPFVPNEALEIANGNPIVAGAGLAANNPFIQFAGNGITHATLLYTITALGPGSSNTNCSGLSIGQSCSIFAGSPLVLTDGASGTTATLAVFGTATDGAGLSNWLGQFQTSFAGMTPLQIQTFFCPGVTCTAGDFASGRSLSSSVSGDFLASAAVPEPATISLGLLGGALLAVGIRKRSRIRP